MRDLERFEPSVVVPDQKSFLDQLVALSFLEKVNINAIVSGNNLKFQRSAMTDKTSETSNSR